MNLSNTKPIFFFHKLTLLPYVLLTILGKFVRNVIPLFLLLTVFEFLETDSSQSFHLYNELPNYNFFISYKSLSFASSFHKAITTQILIVVAFYMTTLVLLLSTYWSFPTIVLIFFKYCLFQSP